MRVEPDDDDRPGPEGGAADRGASAPDPWAAPVRSGASGGAAPGETGEAPVARRVGYWEDETKVAHPAPPQELARVLSPRPRLRAARAAVWVASVLALLDVLISVWGFDEVRRAIGTEDRGGRAPIDDLDGTRTSVDALNTVLDAESGSLVVGGLALIVAAVFVIRWQNVAMHNLRALGVHRRYSPAKAGWSWFIPVWFLFGPKRAYNDAWRAAEPDGETTIGRTHWVNRAVPGVFGAWWVAWLVSLLAEWPSGWSDTTTLADQRTVFVTGAISSLALFVSGPLFVIVMERITDRHDERRAEGLAATAD